MALTEAEFDRVEAYLDGNLSPDENRQMEGDLARDSNLKQAFEEHRVIWEGLQVPVAVAYFQDMHEQLEEQGLLQLDEFWVEADEPEVFVTPDPDDTTSPIEVAVHEDPEWDEKPDGWDGPTEPDAPDTHFDDSNP